MKGRSITKPEKLLHDKLREHGCAVCRHVLNLPLHVLEMPAIHHIEGRTKKGAHRKVIPLCPTHHQYGIKGHPSIHANGSIGGKAQFRAAYDVTELDLLGLCEESLGTNYSECD